MLCANIADHADNLASQDALQSASKRAQVNLVDVLDAAQVGRQSEGSLAAVEVGFAFADELNHDARQSTYEVVIADMCV